MASDPSPLAVERARFASQGVRALAPDGEPELELVELRAIGLEANRAESVRGWVLRAGRRSEPAQPSTGS